MPDGPTAPETPAVAGPAGRTRHPAGSGGDAPGARQDRGAALADALRALIDAAVTTDAPAGDLQAATDAVRAATERLRAHVPPEPRRHLRADAATMADAMPFDLVIGPRNPLAVPLAVHMVDPGGAQPPASAPVPTRGPGGDVPFAATAVANGTFPIAYQGAPGWVHGGAIAAAFDIVLTAANIADGPAGPTVDLRVQYRRPTAVGVPVRFEAAVDHRSPRRVVSRARLVQQGAVTATATGSFALRDPADIDAARRVRG